MKKKVYLLCGLGADERLFGFLDLSAYDVTPVVWLVPEKSESMSAYAARLLPQIDSEKPILIGVSFGGMMAVEIAKLIETERTILISSSATGKQIPRLYKFAGLLRLNRMVSGRMMKQSHRMMNWVFGVGGNVHRKLLGDMLKDSDERFLSWAVDKVVTWDNTVVPATVMRIHGTSDIVLYAKGSDYKIAKAGHFMVADRAKDVDVVIGRIIG